MRALYIPQFTAILALHNPHIMDGRNSAGRKVSLLNENEPRLYAIRLPSIAPSLHSRTNSYVSSAAGDRSPQTPQLVRSDSTDSSDNMQSPSPITPNFAYETISQAGASPMFAPQQPFFSSKDGFAYPPVPQSTNAMPYPTAADVAQMPLFQPPVATPEQMPAASATNPKSKKNQYPCPLAKQYNCPDYFTTSGHAARHAKKHTGKKDAICPDCNKAFTRKDNMEQHRRTHQNGRSSKNSEATRSSKAVKQQQLNKRPKPAPLQTSMAAVDPTLPVSPASSFGMAPAVQPSDSFSQTFTQRSPYAEQMRYSYTMPAGSYNGNISPSSALDTLAEIANQAQV